MSYCKPIYKNKDVINNNPRFFEGGVLKSWDKSTILDPEAQANPCGLVAKWFFTDTYKIFDGEK